MRRAPHYPLARVKEVAAAPSGLLLLRTRALDFFETMLAAYDTAQTTIARLTADDFAHSVELEVDVADVYGVVLEGAGWYLKLMVDESPPDATVVVVSFHPLERPLRTNRGTVKP